MLKSISCRNFRCFREETIFPLAPLTVLVGPNNAGKSTVIDLMRLLSEGYSGKGAAEGLNDDELFNLGFQSGDHRLSSFDKVVSSDRETFEVEIRFDVPRVSDTAVVLSDEVSIRRKYSRHEGSARLQETEGFLLPSGNEPGLNKRGDSTRKRIFYLEFGYDEVATPPGPSGEIPHPHPDYLELGYDWESESLKVEYIEEKIEYIDVGEGESASTTSNITYQGVLDPPLLEMALAYFNVLRERQESPLVDASTLTAQASGSQGSDIFVPKSFGRGFIDSLDPPEGWSADYEDDFWKALKDDFLIPVAEALDHESRPSITYTSSYRASGRAYYGPSEPFTELLRSFDAEGNRTRRRVNEWIEEFGLGKDLQVARRGPSLYQASIERNGERRSLADLGSGVSQLLPLILQLTQASHRDTLLVEEPEANLHPDLQARLADLFGELATRREVVVETHSEYFIRRMQYLVARGEIEPEMVQVLYVEPPEDKSSSQVRPISIDEQGQLSESFGPGFFDEATDLMVDLFKYGSEN